MLAKDVSIIIPAFNEEAAIKLILIDLLQKFPDTEIIVVDDGSEDSTAKIASDTGVKVINHFRNLGYGAALHTGIKASTKDYILFCDADGQHSASDAGQLIESCDNHDMVIGSRGDESFIPLLRRPGKILLRRFANYLAGESIEDLNSGLRIVKKDTIVKYLHLMPKGFSFSTTSTFAFLKSNRKIKWVPITAKKRIGTSTVSLFKDGPQTLILVLRLTVLFEPLKVFLTCSGIVFIFGMISLTMDLIISNWQTIGDTTVLLFISTLIIFLFGLLCDQVSAIRREMHE